MKWKCAALVFVLAFAAHANDKVVTHPTALVNQITQIVSGIDLSQPEHTPTLLPAFELIKHLPPEELSAFYLQAFKSPDINTRIFTLLSASARRQQISSPNARENELFIDVIRQGVLDHAPKVRTQAFSLLSWLPNNVGLNAALVGFADPDAGVRQSCVKVIKGYLKSSLPGVASGTKKAVETLLFSPNPFVSTSALAATDDWSESEWLPSLEKLMASSAELHRQLAIHQLADYNSPQAHKLKLLALQDPSPLIYREAIRSLKSATPSQLNSALLSVMKRNDETAIEAVSDLIFSNPNLMPSPRIRRLLWQQGSVYYKAAALKLDLRESQSLAPSQLHDFGLQKLDHMHEALSSRSPLLQQLGVDLYERAFTLITIQQNPLPKLAAELKLSVEALLRDHPVQARSACSLVPLKSLMITE